MPFFKSSFYLGLVAAHVQARAVYYRRPLTLATFFKEFFSIKLPYKTIDAANPLKYKHLVTIKAGKKIFNQVFSTTSTNDCGVSSCAIHGRCPRGINV